jgi:glycosyltransferase involved in cell wall biosynthesis
MKKKFNRRKKLFVDAHTFDEQHQGIRTFLKGIYSVLDVDKNEFEVILAANNVENLKQEFRHQKDFKFVKLKYTTKYLRLAYEIPKLIKTLQVDYAHFNYYLPLFLSPGCKYIVTIHDVLFIDYPQFFPVKYRLINTYLFKRSAKKADFVTTVSEYSRQRLKKHFDISNKDITILHNAVGNVYLKKHDKAKDKKHIKDKFGIEKYIVFVSRFEPRKNHSLLLQAYKELELWKAGYALVFIGKETFKMQQLQLEMDEVKQQSNHKLYTLDGIDNDDLVKFYNAAEFSVFPSLCEGFGIPPLESAVLKTPTLCSKATAMSDFDFFGEQLFDPISKKELKSKLQDQINSQNHVDVEKISEDILHRYSWDKTAKLLFKLISNH